MADGGRNGEGGEWNRSLASIAFGENHDATPNSESFREQEPSGSSVRRLLFRVTNYGVTIYRLEQKP